MTTEEMLKENCPKIRAAMDLLQYFIDDNVTEDDQQIQQIFATADLALYELEQPPVPRMCGQGCGVVLGTDGCSHAW